MATITMDTTEYELMKESKLNLEKAIERQEELQAKINLLTEEKIKAYEEAKMKVVKVNKTVTTEHVLMKRENHQDVVRILLRGLGINNYNPNYIIPEYLHISDMQEAFFEKVSNTHEDVGKITTHGLDEVKLELKTELELKTDTDTKEKILKAESALKTNSELILDNKEISFRLKQLDNMNNKMIDDLENSEKEVFELKKEADKISKIKEVLQNRYAILGRVRLLDKVISIIAQ